MVENPPAMQETWVWSWVGKIPWRREWQSTLVFLLGESPWTEELGGLQSMGSQRVGHSGVTKHSRAQSLVPGWARDPGWAHHSLVHPGTVTVRVWEMAPERLLFPTALYLARWCAALSYPVMSMDCSLPGSLWPHGGKCLPHCRCIPYHLSHQGS